MKQSERLAALKWTDVIRRNWRIKADILTCADFLLRRTEFVPGKKRMMRRDGFGLSSHDYPTIRKIRARIKMCLHDEDDLLRAAKILYRYRKQLKFNIISGQRC